MTCVINKCLALTILALLPMMIIAEDPTMSATIVVMLAEDEYKTEETVPAFAEAELKPLGMTYTTVLADPPGSANFPLLETVLPQADLLFISVRRRAPTIPQLQLIRQHLAAGKPLIGIRTASHAFAVKTTIEQGHAEWKTFDHDILGGSYNGHYGNESALLTIADGAQAHPILQGINPSLFKTHRLYKNATIGAQASPLIMGKAQGQQEIHHVAWCNMVGESRIFYTSLGTPEDFKEAVFTQLLKNAVLWTLGREALIKKPSALPNQ